MGFIIFYHKFFEIPNCKVSLIGKDGNAFSILGNVQNNLRKYLRAKENKSIEDTKLIIDEFLKEAMDGDYDHLLQTCMKWVTVD